MKMRWLEGVRGGGPHVGPGGWWGTRSQNATEHHPPLPPWLVALICFRVFPAKSRKLKLKHYRCLPKWNGDIWHIGLHMKTNENFIFYRNTAVGQTSAEITNKCQSTLAAKMEWLTPWCLWTHKNKTKSQYRVSLCTTKTKW